MVSNPDTRRGQIQADNAAESVALHKLLRVDALPIHTTKRDDYLRKGKDGKHVRKQHDKECLARADHGLERGGPDVPQRHAENNQKHFT